MKQQRRVKEDFSLKWFGIPDAVIVKFWDRLEKLPRPSKLQIEIWEERMKAEAVSSK